MLYRWEGTTGKFSIINWVDKVNWPPLRVSKLTFRALVLRQSEWRNCGNIPSAATVTYKLMVTKLRQSFRRFHRKPIFQSIQRSQTRTKRSLHEQLYRRYLSSREELTQFITTVKFFSPGTERYLGNFRHFFGFSRHKEFQFKATFYAL